MSKTKMDKNAAFWTIAENELNTDIPYYVKNSLL